MSEEEIIVPHSVIQKAADHYSAQLINTDDLRKSQARVFHWNGRAWTCIGSLSQGLDLLHVEIVEVVLEQLYTGPAFEKNSRSYYTGARFRYGGQVWVLTSNKVRLLKDEKPEEQVKQLSLFAR